jgi:hypothetical protein
MESDLFEISTSILQSEILLQPGPVSVPDPDPPVFGPPGSGSVNHRYGFGSGSFHQQAKIVRKTLTFTVL